MDTHGLLTLSQYNAYANGLVFDTIARLPPEELQQEASPSHGSVVKLLLHMFAVELFFFTACQNGEGTAGKPARPSTLADLRPAWADLETARLSYLGSCTQADLARQHSIRLGGQMLHYTAAQMLMQSMLHSTHHRGELSIVLTRLGHPLPTLDIILQFTQQSGQVWPLK